MDLITTINGSAMEGFLPRGWDLAKIDRLAALGPEAATARQPWWHAQFEPVGCAS
jgi:glucosamine-6-phosphate deaminase